MDQSIETREEGFPQIQREIHVAPVPETQRIELLDVLRGFALLGILVMNIPWFAWSASAFFNPTLQGGFDGANYGVWLVSHLFFDLKMWTLFAMLFGAGMLVFTERAAAAGRSPAGLYYRRLAWLLLFGLLHAYLLWSGDILYSYALCGMLIYPLRRLRPFWLIVIALVLFVIGLAIMVGQGWFFSTARDAAIAAQQAIDAGHTPGDFQRSMLEVWPSIEADFVPDEKARAEEAAAYLGSYGDLFGFRAVEAFFMQTFLFAAMLLWRTTAIMLFGMALMKLGVLTGKRSNAFYALFAGIGYVVGLPIVYFGAQRMHGHDFDFVKLFQSDLAFNAVGSILVAFGHIGMLTLIWRSGVVRPVLNAIAAVGRMALTNYLMHSILCSIIFFGWGFGYWGSLSRVQTVSIVLAIWVMQLIVSPIWLKRFRFGPFEWLWRSLTYFKLQPMRRTA